MGLRLLEVQFEEDLGEDLEEGASQKMVVAAVLVVWIVGFVTEHMDSEAGVQYFVVVVHPHAVELEAGNLELGHTGLTEEL